MVKETKEYINLLKLNGKKEIGIFERIYAPININLHATFRLIEILEDIVDSQEPKNEDLLIRLDDLRNTMFFNLAELKKIVGETNERKKEKEI